MRDFVLASSAFLVALIGTGFFRRHALKRNLLDIPNERSSHRLATPRGGGLAIVLATMLSFAALAGIGVIDRSLFIALAGGGGAVAVVGYLDDRYQLRAGIRLTVHFGAAICALHSLGGMPALQFGDRILSFGPVGYVVSAVGIVWVLNLFNFMDGIDGIAASEAAFIAWAGSMLALLVGIENSDAVFSASLVFGAACCGFLAWNWPPAKIFMGDAGSGFLGFVIAILAIAAARDNPIALLVWLILGAVFFVDATVTLFVRLARGEQVHTAHRSHAYQWLARRWGSHRRVTLTVIAVNLLWLSPCALVAVFYPAAAGWVMVVALAPIVVAVIAAGAGRPEVKAHK